MPTFEQKPVTATKAASKDLGEYREILIEKHEKDSDLRKLVGIYKRDLDAEVVGTSDEGITVRYLASRAKRHEKEAQDKANAAVKRTATVRPNDNYSSIAEVHANTVENISAQELLGG